MNVDPQTYWECPAELLKVPPIHLFMDPQYGGQDCDTLMFLGHFDEAPNSLILEVGANEEASCRILADNGHKVVGVDLRKHDWRLPHNYLRIQGDFIEVAPALKRVISAFDVVFSTSAIEHFGLPLYGFHSRIPDYDIQTTDWIYQLLRPGGTYYLTVPYGRDFREDPDWRVYNHTALQARLVGRFLVERKVFFLSGGCHCPHVDGIVTQKDADQYDGSPPHLTVFCKMRKSASCTH